MISTAISKHQHRYHTYGIDIPISQKELFRVVKWRDRHVTNWSEGVAIYKQIGVKLTATIGLAIVTVLSVAELIGRNIAFLIFMPFMPFESTRTPGTRLQQSVLETLSTGLFSLEAQYYNLVEKRIAMKMINPRLAMRYKEIFLKV